MILHFFDVLFSSFQGTPPTMPPSNKGSVLATFYPTGFGDPAVAWQTRFRTERIPLAMVGDCWGFGDGDGWEKILKSLALLLFS